MDYDLFGWDVNKILERLKTQDTAHNKEDEEVKNAYEAASGVDLEFQRKLWDERAKGYWGEYKVFSLLFKKVDLPCKILVNVRIPADDGHSTEIDLILIATTGVYVFEVKHYQGRIYGGSVSPTWTAYFKTRESISFDNPLMQNEYHIKNLSKLIPKINIYSYVVFTNRIADTKVSGRYPGAKTVCDINDLSDRLSEDFAGHKEIYSEEQIEQIFKKISPYSPMESNSGDYFKMENRSVPFSEFADAIIQELNQEKEKNRELVKTEVLRQTESLRHQQEELEKLKCENLMQMAAASEERDQAVHALEEFSKNFKLVSPSICDNVAINKDCFTSEVKFEYSDSFMNTINMTFSFGNLSSEWWIRTKDAWFIVGLRNGGVQKYVLKEHIKNYSGQASWIPPQGMLQTHTILLYNTTIEEIRYIKMCNAEVTSNLQITSSNLAPGVEFEVYVGEGVQSIYCTENLTCGI